MTKRTKDDSKCNTRVTADTVAKTGESKAIIDHVISFQFRFIASKIEEGSFETVRVAGFGTFRAKTKSVQWRDYMKSMPEGYRKLIRRR